MKKAYTVCFYFSMPFVAFYLAALQKLNAMQSSLATARAGRFLSIIALAAVIAVLTFAAIGAAEYLLSRAKKRYLLLSALLCVLFVLVWFSPFKATFNIFSLVYGQFPFYGYRFIFPAIYCMVVYLYSVGKEKRKS